MSKIDVYKNFADKHKLAGGTDISRMTTSQIDEALRREQAEFTAKQRKKSPKFPSVHEALLRRQLQRENIAARFLLAMFLFGLIDGVFFDNVGYAVALFGGVGFIITCIVAGNRSYKRSLPRGRRAF